MAIVADLCLTDGLGADNVSHKPGILNLRSVAWPYTASIATATGLKIDPTSGFPYTDPIDGVLDQGVSIAGRSEPGDPGTAGTSMLSGLAPWISTTLTNTGHRPVWVFYLGSFDYRHVFTCYASLASNDSQYFAQSLTTAGNATPADPSLVAYNIPNAESFGGVITAGLGGSIIRGGRHEVTQGLGLLNPGDSMSAKATVAFNRGPLGYSAGAYDSRIVYNFQFHLIGWPIPPTF